METRGTEFKARQDSAWSEKRMCDASERHRTVYHGAPFWSETVRVICIHHLGVVVSVLATSRISEGPIRMDSIWSKEMCFLAKIIRGLSE